MGKRPIVSLLLSLFFPGLGHIYAGKGYKGAAILLASIIIASLNIILLLVFVSANPYPESIWSHWIPRIGHDVIVIWSVVFWIWVIVDSCQETKAQLPAARKRIVPRFQFWLIAAVPAFSLVIDHYVTRFVPLGFVSEAFIIGDRFYLDILLVYVIPSVLIPLLVAFAITLVYPVVFDMVNALLFAIPVFIVHLIFYSIPIFFNSYTFYSWRAFRLHLIRNIELYFLLGILLFASTALFSRLGSRIRKGRSRSAVQLNLQRPPLMQIRKRKPLGTLNDYSSKRMNRFLYSIAKTRIGSLLLHWIIAYFSFTIPGEKLIETDSLLAFHHPLPVYPLHILIVPKAKFRSLNDLPSDDNVFESGMFLAINMLVQKFNLEAHGYRLIANGGSTQEVDHLHFHLVSDKYEVDL